MAKHQQASTSFSATTDKKFWVAPAIHVLDIKEAQGSGAGNLTDKFGSLSCLPGATCYTH